MVSHSSILLAWKIPCTGEPGGLQSMGLSQTRPKHAYTHTHTHTHTQSNDYGPELTK